MYDNLMRRHSFVTVSDDCSSQVICCIQQVLCNKSASITDGSANLLLQYMKMVQILMKFMKAEHLGNWALDLEAVSDMHPYFA